MNFAAAIPGAMRRLAGRLVLGLAVLAAGCTTPAPPYHASVANAEVTAALKNPLAVGRFEFEAGREAALNQVGARGSGFVSPVNASYADYFADAAVKELRSGGRFDASAPRVLTAVITRNDLSGGGVSTNDAEIAARFRLRKDGRMLYDHEVGVRHEWESSFLGAIAIPRALDNYIVTLQKLLRQLFSDPRFVAATAEP